MFNSLFNYTNDIQKDFIILKIVVIQVIIDLLNKRRNSILTLIIYANHEPVLLKILEYPG